MNKSLKIVGWIYFILSFIGALIIFSNSEVESINYVGAIPVRETTTSSLIIALGFASILQGIIILLVCLSLSEIIERQKDIFSFIKMSFSNYKEFNYINNTGEKSVTSENLKLPKSDIIMDFNNISSKLKETNLQLRIKIIQDNTPIFLEANNKSKIINRLKAGEIITAKGQYGEFNEWYQIETTEELGYILTSDVNIVK